MTFAAHMAERNAYDRLNDRLRTEPGDKEGKLLQKTLSQSTLLIKQARDEANKTALTPVLIPTDLVSRIKTLYAKSVDGNTPQDQVPSLKQKMRQLILNSELFRKVHS